MKYFYWNSFKSEISAITTTREVGNMAYQIGEDHEGVSKAREIVALDLGVDTGHMIFTHQTHSDVIKEVTSADQGRGKDSFLSGIEADALYTTERGLALGCFHADCVPIFVYIPSIPLVGIIHAGYQGTLKHIAYKSIMHLKEKYKVNGEDIFCHLGPARQFYSFRVKKEDKEHIFEAGCEKAYRYDKDEGFFDAPFSNVNDLVNAGVPYKNIDSCEVDTCDDNNCYSAILEEKKNGRMSSIIMLN
ncbi:MAG: polyphenol oxidase family protein [Coprobacillus sp.]|nr:polyphenol oxidase family protein [Coprobacillus sp.]